MESEAQEKEWELEDAVRTLVKAEEIKQDKALMKQLGPHLDKKVKAIKSIADLKRVKKERDMSGESEES